MDLSLVFGVLAAIGAIFYSYLSIQNQKPKNDPIPTKKEKHQKSNKKSNKKANKKSSNNNKNNEKLSNIETSTTASSSNNAATNSSNGSPSKESLGSLSGSGRLSSLDTGVASSVASVDKNEPENLMNENQNSNLSAAGDNNNNNSNNKNSDNNNNNLPIVSLNSAVKQINSIIANIQLNKPTQLPNLYEKLQLTDYETHKELKSNFSNLKKKVNRIETANEKYADQVTNLTRDLTSRTNEVERLLSNKNLIEDRARQAFQKDLDKLKLELEKTKIQNSKLEKDQKDHEKIVKEANSKAEKAIEDKKNSENLSKIMSQQMSEFSVKKKIAENQKSLEIEQEVNAKVDEKLKILSVDYQERNQRLLAILEQKNEEITALQNEKAAIQMNSSGLQLSDETSKALNNELNSMIDQLRQEKEDLREGGLLWVYIVFFSNIRVETLGMLFEHVIFGLEIFVAAWADNPGVFAMVAGFSSTSFDLFWAEDHEVWESSYCCNFRLTNKNV